MRLWRIINREASWRGMSACGGAVCGGVPQERKGEGERWGVAVSGA